MLVCEHAKVVGFVRVVAIEEEEDRVIIQLVSGGKWDKSLFEPFKAEFVVGPPIG